VSNNTPSILAQDSSKIENYGFRLIFEHEKLAHHFIYDIGVSSASAYKCVSSYQNMDSVISIDVITRNNFDNTHPAGSSVAEYLLVRPGSLSFDPGPYLYKSISESIYYINPTNAINNNILDFRFKNISPFPGQHEFIVTVSFQSGRTLSGGTSIRLY
jgi:hypothetical protein